MNGAEELNGAPLPSEERVLQLYGPRRSEVFERLRSALRYGEITRWGSRGGEVIFVPPPRPLLIPPGEPSQLLRPGALRPPPGREFFVIDGGEAADAELEGHWIRRGKYIKGVLKGREKRYFSYIFLSPEEALVPFLLVSSTPPVDPSSFPAVHEAIYYKKGGSAYLLKTTFSTPSRGAPLFTGLLKEMGATLEEVLQGSDREVELQRFLKDSVLPALSGALSLLSEQYRRSVQRGAEAGEGLAGKIVALKGAGVVNPQDVGGWVGALSGLIPEVTTSLGALPLPGEMRGMLQHFRRAFGSSEAMKSSVRIFKALQGTPRILLLTSLKLENLAEEGGGVRYVSDPLGPSLSEEALFSSPPPAHLSPLLNSLSRLSLVSFRREALQRLKGDVERAVALSRARFILSTAPRRIEAVVKPSSPLFHLKLTSEHGYLSERLLRFAEQYLAENLMRMYIEGGHTLSPQVVLSSLYLFAIMRQLYELKERIEMGQLSTSYLADALLLIIRNLNKYEALYSGRGQKYASGDQARR